MVFVTVAANKNGDIMDEFKTGKEVQVMLDEWF